MNNDKSFRPTIALIDLERLRMNFLNSKEFIGDSVKYMAVVKADAYGHGAVRCAQELERAGVDWFGVALPEEGCELRKNGVLKPILCLGSFWNNQIELLIDNDLTPVIYQLEKCFALNETATKLNVLLNVHLKVDTGMGRIGIRYDEFEKFVERFLDFKYLRIDGVMTHFASADDPNQNNFTDLQIERFNECVKILENYNIHPTYKDMANSPGAIMHQNSRGNLVRLGGILYGLAHDIIPQNVVCPELLPVLTLRTEVAHLKTVPIGETLGYTRSFKTVRDSRIATLPIGYQDGYSRLLSNRGRVLINDQFAPVVGVVSMDWTIVDVTDIPNVKLGDKAIIIGRQNDKQISAEEIAREIGTISYEITCGINRRVPRVYV